ncbi:MAG: response regulator transcription factor [Armatimonadota bacterium]|nr:response regulator transcription factor [Armatimonadota bacterium]
MSTAASDRARILVVDDEPQLLKLVTSLLTAAGFTVVTAQDGETALEIAATQNPDLVLLDIMLPGALDGLGVARRLREFSTVPIIMLTAKAREIDEVAGFDAGADDYITKPFSAATLVARVQASLRRVSAPEAQAATLTIGDVVIDLWRHEVRRDGHLVSLTPTEFKLLQELATHAGKVLLHRDLLTRVWGPEYRDDVDYLRTYIRSLRRKLEKTPSEPRLIVTRPGVGYMLVPPDGSPTASSTPGRRRQ